MARPVRRYLPLEPDPEWRAPSRLSPSRASEFRKCPRRYFYGNVLRLPSPSGVDAVRGTCVHLVLEKLFDRPPDRRTVEDALGLLPEAWSELASTADVEVVTDVDGFLDECRALIANYYTLETPSRFTPAERELRLEAVVSGVPLVGIIDRLDLVKAPNGDELWYISDYKTGKAPKERYRSEAFLGLKVYALLLRQTRGHETHQVRLVHLRDVPDEDNPPQVLSINPTSAQLASTERTLVAVWDGIHAALADGDFQPSPSPLCGWCPFIHLCPAHNPELDGVAVAPRERTART